MVDLKIENVIAEAEFESNIDLQKIANSIKDVNYNPDHFPGLVYKLKSPKTVTLIFSKGHSVCTGATSLQNAKAALSIIYKKLKDLNLIQNEKIPNITIQNIIVSYNFKKKLDLDKVSKNLAATNAEVTYDRKKFPGIIYHDKITDITVLLFKSGIIVGYGSPILLELDQLLTELEQHYT